MQCRCELLVISTLSARSAAQGNEDIFINIDPIDGTTAFKDGGDAFCVGVSIERRNGAVLYAVVYIPSREKGYVLTHEYSEVIIYDFDKMPKVGATVSKLGKLTY